MLYILCVLFNGPIPVLSSSQLLVSDLISLHQDPRNSNQTNALKRMNSCEITVSPKKKSTNINKLVSQLDSDSAKLVIKFNYFFQPDSTLQRMLNRAMNACLVCITRSGIGTTSCTTDSVNGSLFVDKPQQPIDRLS